MSLHTEEVPWEDHCSWFEAVLQTDRRHLLIGERADQRVGTVRLDQDGTRATINITVAPNARGQGVGVELLRAAADYAQSIGISFIDAVIRPQNRASQIIFARAGYQASGQDDGVDHYPLIVE